MSERIPFPKYLDSSMISAFKKCPRQYFYKYLRHLQLHQKSIHLIAGGAFARGLEVVRKSYYSPSSLYHRNLDEALAAGIGAAVKDWGDHPDPFENEKSLTRICEALVEYFHVYNPEHDHIQPFYFPDSSPAVECCFSLPIGVNHPETGEELFYVGRYDMLGQVEGDGLFAVDEKTTTRLGPTWNKQWDLRGQFTGYCWAAQEYGFPVIGIAVRGVSFLSHGKFGHAEVFKYRPAHMIADWLQSTRSAIELMKWSWEHEHFLQNLDDSCTSYSGCDYTLLCTKRDPERWVEPNYVVSQWDPLRIAGVEV